MNQIEEVINYLESFAPLDYQEGYDNAGLLVGDKKADLTGILISLDITEVVIDEAIQKGCNLIVAHHPIIFSGLKKLTGKNYVERTVIKAIKNDIALYAAHTNLDNIQQGVNQKIAQKIGLKNTRILSPKKGVLKKLTFFCPSSHSQSVVKELHTIGAGTIGNYSDCSFRTTGEGTFTPNEQASPHTGAIHKAEKVKEDRIELLVPSHLSQQAVATLHINHPYEEVAYYLQNLENSSQDIGSGMIGELEQPIETIEFLNVLKSTFNLSVIKHTEITTKTIKSVALCGGSGSFLLPHAIAVHADIFITGDFKYHEFFDADEKVIIADIGHYESEACTKELFYDILTKKITNIAVYLTEVDTNPVSYFI
ncbi:MAG: Nif3-like dinuclear metal center hexameric protein [Cyclobacteriaceae bacterium]